jgi:glucans biosynthesis protein
MFFHVRFAQFFGYRICVRRREVLKSALLLPFAAAVPGLAGRAIARTAGSDLPYSGRFDDTTVPALARALAAHPFSNDAAELPPTLARIDYDDFRQIRFEPAQALWRGDGLPFQAQFFHRGFLYHQRVDVHELAAGASRPVAYRPGMFRFDGDVAPVPGDLGFAGFRLHAPLNRPDYFDEVCAFLGASYFRAVAEGQAYGLSARGLALRTGDPAGEEFPFFRAFWLERPAAGAGHITLHALMDGPSAAAAFRFDVTPGAQTVFDVDMRLYPRVALAQAGIAPLTSMFQFDASDRVGIDDYRAAVHDSDGLAMLNGAGEQLWRPLRNPATLQESAFEDATPRGFGLMQRKRAFADFGDAEARYHLRPSLWVEPLGDWGEGSVRLFEIPTADEYHDNIVAFWRPRAPLAAGREHRFRYRLHWCDRHAWTPALATVEQTRIGAGPDGSRQVVLDLDGGALAQWSGDTPPRADVTTDAGRLANVVASRGPAGRWHLAFELHPRAHAASELRATLRAADGAPLSETWLYRWT